MFVVIITHILQPVGEIDIMFPRQVQCAMCGTAPLHSDDKGHEGCHFFRLAVQADTYSRCDVGRDGFYPTFRPHIVEREEVEFPYYIDGYQMVGPHPVILYYKTRAIGAIASDAMLHSFGSDGPSAVEHIAEIDSIRLPHILKDMLCGIPDIVTASAIYAQFAVQHALFCTKRAATEQQTYAKHYMNGLFSHSRASLHITACKGTTFF